MTATQQKVEMWTGDDVVIPFNIVNEYGAPENLSTFDDFHFAVRDKPKGAISIVAEKTLGDGIAIIGDPLNGRLEVTLDSADTADFLVGGSKVTLYHELEGTQTGPKIKTLAEGPFVLHQSLAGAGV